MTEGFYFFYGVRKTGTQGPCLYEVYKSKQSFPDELGLQARKTNKKRRKQATNVK